MTKTFWLAAACAALAGPALATHGEEDGPVLCLPGYIDFHENPTISTLCDATAANKRLRLKIDHATGCAVPGQEVRRGKMLGVLNDQVRFVEYVPEGTTPAPLRSCKDDEAVRFEMQN